MKRNKTIPEKDAKIILMQILSGLRYLNRPLSYLPNNGNNGSSNGSNGSGMNNGDDEFGGTGGSGISAYSSFNNKMNASKRLSIIHYDLKPANILFDETGDVKITGRFTSCPCTQH